MQRKLNNNKTL